jgi:hypothetical protein
MMKAKFKAKAVSESRGRGMVIAGWLVHGTCRVGSSILIPGFPRRLIIKAFDHVYVDAQAGGAFAFELLLPVSDEAEQTLLRELVVEGQVLEIRDHDIPREYVLLAFAVLLFPSRAPLIGFGLGFLEMYALRMSAIQWLIVDPLLAIVLNTGLGTLALLVFCSVGTNALCDRNPIILTIIPSIVITAVLATNVVIWAVGYLRRLRQPKL